jgi:hypothetical protein
MEEKKGEVRMKGTAGKDVTLDKENPTEFEVRNIEDLVVARAQGLDEAIANLLREGCTVAFRDSDSGLVFALNVDLIEQDDRVWLKVYEGRIRTVAYVEKNLYDVLDEVYELVAPDCSQSDFVTGFVEELSMNREFGHEIAWVAMACINEADEVVPRDGRDKAILDAVSTLLTKVQNMGPDF